MLYVDFTAGGKDYKLRLNTRAVVGLEKQLGMNPLAIFGNGDSLPTVTTIIQILHASLQQYQHGISFDDVYDIYDAYIADGHVMTDLIPVIVDLYKASGLIKDVNKGDSEKNA